MTDIVYKRDEDYVSDPNANQPTKIVSAAILINGRIWTGKRHAYLIYQILQDVENPKIPQKTQGFLADNGQFFRRKDANVIAFKAGQINELGNSLLSEELW